MDRRIWSDCWHHHWFVAAMNLRRVDPWPKIVRFYDKLFPLLVLVTSKWLPTWQLP